MKKSRLFFFLIVFCSILSVPHSPLFAQSIDQQLLEKKFDSYLKAENLRERMKRLTAHPHHVGSPWDKANADYIDSLFTAWGFDTHIEEFQVLFPTPKTRLLEMTGPEKFTAKLVEPAVNEDGTSGQLDEQLPTYNAYSIDGDVTGELVYVNYGVPKDYEELEARGIDVKGKIVISRYGGSWRGIKPKVAAEHGAIGCIIYSDPNDDGYYAGDVYPKGAFRNENGTQRGSVADSPLFSGDPLTPFIGATKNAKRLAIKDAPTLTKIPVLPISYSDATPLLQSLSGQVVPESWRGSLPITYHFGPGKTTVHLKLEFNWDLKTIRDVIGTIKGNEYPEEWLIRGNHYDAWVNGAEDPISGQVAMEEEARALGELLKTGWKPKRTIMYCAWDAEEPGLIGSTEWCETHAEELQKKGVVYINSDGNGRGFLSAGGSHTLEKFVNQIAADVVDPEKNISVADRLRANRIINGSADDRKDARERKDFHLYALGSGSDYTPFIQHLGISALNIGYGGESDGGSYHSIYDSYDYYTRFIDPSFAYGVALSQTGGRLILRLANAEVLPFEFTNFSETVTKYVKEVAKLTDDMRDETAELNRKINDKSFEWASDPMLTFMLPKPKETVPFINFAPLQNAVAKLQQNAKQCSDAAASKQLSKDTQAKLNAILMNFERVLTRSEGLLHRPWFTHQIYAPGMYTGYGVKTLPSVREAIELRKWGEAEGQVTVVANVLEQAANEIGKAVAIITVSAK